MTASVADLRSTGHGLEALGAALHAAARRHRATVSAVRGRLEQLGGVGTAPALQERAVRLSSTAAALSAVPDHLDDAGRRTLQLARTAADTASTLTGLERETTALEVQAAAVRTEPSAHAQLVERLDQLVRRRAGLLATWDAACRTAQRDLDDVGGALAAVERALAQQRPPGLLASVTRAAAGLASHLGDLDALREGADIHGHVQLLRDAGRRQRTVQLDGQRRAAGAARRAADRVARGVRGAASAAPSVVRRAGALGASTGVRVLRAAGDRAARLADSRAARGLHAVGRHPTVAAVSKRLGPVGLVLSGVSTAQALREGRRADAAVGTVGLVAGGILVLGVGGVVASPVVVGAAVVAAGVVLYEHRDRIAQGARWVGSKVRGGLRRLRRGRS